MNPFSPGQDVFETQADNRFNSFSDPMNAVNMNRGQWGINPSYMTPSYTSPYRPRYQGPQGDPYGNANPTWAQSANYIANPFRSGGDNYGGNYWQQSTPAFNSFVNRPVDQTAGFMQNYGVPLAAGYGAMRAFGGFGSRVGGAMGAGAIRGLLGSSVGTGTTSMAMSAGKMVGGMAGGLMIPAAIAQAGISGFDAAVMDPYIAQRQTSNNLRQNFAGQTFGQSGVGDPYQGGGLSRKFAAGIAKDISKFAAQDLTFNQKEVATLTDYSARAGLLDNTNAHQLTSRMKDITKQVKLVMSVANTSDFKEAIEILGKLQMAGATGGAASRVMTQLGSFAAMGGISTQKLMNTVGAQGQYVFGANGLTPYVGQMAAGQAYGSMASAFRSGLLSPALAARMGGVEGATQSAVSGLVGMAQSPYAAMYAHNAYMNGGETGNIVSNVSRFGGDMARSGMSGIGDFNMNRPASISRMIEERGPKLIEDMVSQAGKLTPDSLNSKGQVKSGAAYMLLTKTYGMQDDQARAMLEQLRSYQDEGAVNQMLAGSDRAKVDNRMKFMQQQGADYGRFTPAVQAVLGVGRNIQEGGANIVGKMLGTHGSVGDSIQNWWNEAKFGNVAGMNGIGLEQVKGTKNIDLETAGEKTNRRQLLKIDSFSSDNQDALKDIHKAVANGNKDAIDFINSTGVKQKSALANLVKSNVVDKSFMEVKGSDSLISDLGKLSTTTTKSGMEEVDKAFAGIKDMEGAGIIGKGQFMTATKGLLTNAEGSKQYNSHKKKLEELLGEGELSPQRLKEILNGDSVKSGLINGVEDYSAAMGVKDDKDFANQIQKAGGIDRLASSKLHGEFLELYNSTKTKGNEHEAYAKAMQLQAGGKLKGAKLINVDHVDNASLAQQSDSESVIDKQRQQITNLAKSHKIDFSAYEQGLAALDNKEATGAFSDAVSRFSQAVGDMRNSGTLTPAEQKNQVNSQVRNNGKN